MQARYKIIFLSLLCFSVGFCVFPNSLFAAEITIVGEVNDSYQIEADGQFYEVANTAMGDDLVKNYMALKVMVKGTVEEKEDIKIITVTSFKVLPE